MEYGQTKNAVETGYFPKHWKVRGDIGSYHSYLHVSQFGLRSDAAWPWAT